MQLFPTTVILRHHRENLKKCSLRGLEGRPDLKFFSYPERHPIHEEWRDYVLLTLEAPPLTFEDRACGLFLIDATWRYAKKMLRSVEGIPHLIPRSLPSHFRTAYPRRQVDCSDPERGLASVEALFLSYMIFGREAESLLENYYWKNEFLETNKAFIDLK
jgi:pre-rRNA-processing protein TSR3